MRRRALPVAVIGVLVGLGAPVVTMTAGPAHGAPLAAGLAPHAADVLLVGFRPGTSSADRVAARAALKVADAVPLSPLAGDAERWRLPAGTAVGHVLTAVRANPVVRFAEPDYVVTTDAVSDDPLVVDGTLWGMYGNSSFPANQFGSQAAEAWDRGHTGSSSVVVGVIDEGVQITHPDLVDNIWVNPTERNGVTGVDDDRNGYVDDVSGWDFQNNDATVYDGGTQGIADRHGTHVAGTIGATGGNGTGVAGVNWDVTIVPGKFLGATGGLISDAVRAVDYMTDLARIHGLRMVATSNSWTGGGFSQALHDAINRGGDAGILFVAAAGNATANNDLVAEYPGNYQCTTATRPWDCVVSVGSITSTGGLSSFSNYGPLTVDIAAPGSGVTSTVPPSAYGSMSGTSMATPHVTGALALCAAAKPTLGAAQLRSILLDTMVPTASLNGRTSRAGRLDTSSALTACVGGSTPSGAPSGLTASAPTWSTTTLSWTDGVTGESNWVVQRATSTAGVCGTFAAVGTFGANVTQFFDSRLGGSTTYCYRVQAQGGGSSTSFSNVATVTTPVAPPQPSPYTCGQTTYSWIDYNVGGTRRTLADDDSIAVALPFTMPFYGTSYTTASMSSNGYIRFGTGSAVSFLNTAIPNITDPNNIAAAWWDDLDPALGGSLWTIQQGTSPNRRVAFSWVDMQRAGGSANPVTFQIVLDEATTSITLQYRDAVTDLDSNGASATVGLESADGEMGTLVSHNQAGLLSGTAYRCTSNAALSPVAISTGSLPVGTIGIPYSATLAATGGSGTYGWSVTSGVLPAGLTLSSVGVLSGTPTTAGSSTFAITAADTAPGATGSTSRQFTIPVATPVQITTGSTLPSGTVGAPYSQTLVATGGSGGYTWTRTAGTLPAGVTMSTSGVLSGTPTTAGSYSFTVVATDSAGRTASRLLGLTIGSSALPGAFGKSSPKNGATGVKTTTTLSWTASTGAVSYQYCIDTTDDNACTSNTWASTGTTRSVSLSGLLKGTRYYWQVRAVNANGTTIANAGAWWGFTTATR